MTETKIIPTWIVLIALVFGGLIFWEEFYPPPPRKMQPPYLRIVTQPEHHIVQVIASINGQNAIYVPYSKEQLDKLIHDLEQRRDELP